MNTGSSRSNLQCPHESEWTSLAVGLIQGKEAERLLAHAAECHPCSSILRDTLFLVSEPADAPTTSDDVSKVPQSDIRGLSTAMAQAACDREMRAIDTRSSWFGTVAGYLTTRRSLVGAVVAAGLAVAFMFPRAGDLLRFGPSPPFTTLAEAYSTRRTIELRIPGARYAPMRDRRSANRRNLPPELLESLATIQRRLQRDATDAEWLHAYGRAQVLTGDFDGALQTFQSASDKANTPEFWIDFATAHFQRGELTRDASEYGAAVRLLDRALQARPGDSAALFNRAIVYSRLSRTDEAINDLKLCLTTETDSGWNEEARRLLDEIRRRSGA